MHFIDNEALSKLKVKTRHTAKLLIEDSGFC